ncbi:hypothetical protein HK104_007757, partial [Borealophlyctis nickersoniae]
MSFTVHKTGWTTSQIPDLTGKVALVTGGNTGLGYHTSLELARRNATVLIACRNVEKGGEAAEKIKAETGKSVEVVELDLMDLKGVKACGEEVKKRVGRLDVLVNNAGIMATPFTLTKDALESQFATNHVGHFLLTLTLLPLLKSSAPSRIVNLSSVAHRRAPKEGVMFDHINDEKAMGPWARYGQ